MSALTVNHGSAGTPIAGQSLHHHGGAAVALPQTAELRGHHQTEQTQLRHGVQRLARKRVRLVAVDLGGGGSEPSCRRSGVGVWYVCCNLLQWVEVVLQHGYDHDW